MGGGGEFPVERIYAAVKRYREHKDAGDDMVLAGEELFKEVEDASMPRPCGPPRTTLLEEISINRDIQDLRDIEQLVLENSPDNDERRKVLRRIDERIDELQSMNSSRRTLPPYDFENLPSTDYDGEVVYLEDLENPTDHHDPNGN